MLANPRIRVKNKDKARIHIGDRVPVITTTAAATGGFISESVTYLDVGLRLEVEPLVHLEDEVAIKVGLEVSNIAREFAAPTPTRWPTRSARATRPRTYGCATARPRSSRASSAMKTAAPRIACRAWASCRCSAAFSRTRATASDARRSCCSSRLRVLRTLARPDARAIEFAAGTEASTGARPGPIAPLTIPQSISPPQAVPAQPASEEGAKPAPTPTPGAAPVVPMVPFGGARRPVNEGLHAHRARNHRGHRRDIGLGRLAAA